MDADLAHRLIGVEDPSFCLPQSHNCRAQGPSPPANGAALQLEATETKVPDPRTPVNQGPGDQSQNPSPKQQLYINTADEQLRAADNRRKGSFQFTVKYQIFKEMKGFSKGGRANLR